MVEVIRHLFSLVGIPSSIPVKTKKFMSGKFYRLTGSIRRDKLELNHL